MEFISVDTTNTFLLERFVQSAGSSLATFRYFAKRPFSIVAHHLCTWVIQDDGRIEAYGHLDRDGDTVWLGVAVAEKARGKGLGRMMMERLMGSARALGLQIVRLTVDNSNQVAIRLYENSGFRLLKTHETLGLYEWRNSSPDSEQSSAQ
jgi:RimJ/RimL family protein N-acetyltransferase